MSKEESERLSDARYFVSALKRKNQHCREQVGIIREDVVQHNEVVYRAGEVVVFRPDILMAQQGDVYNGRVTTFAIPVRNRLSQKIKKEGAYYEIPRLVAGTEIPRNFIRVLA